MARPHAGSPVQDSSVDEQRSEICRQCNVEVPVDFDYVMEWLKRAEADAKEAKGSKSATHALYWIQQSAEKLVKGRLLALGRCYCDVVDVGHGSLKGYQRVVDDLLQDRTLRDLTDGLVGSNSQQKLTALQALLSDEYMRSELAIWGREDLDVLFDSVYRLERKWGNLLSDACRIGAVEHDPPSKVYGRLCQAISRRFTHRRKTDGVDDLIVRIRSAFGVCDHQLNGKGRLLTAKDMEGRLRWAGAEVRLFILACVTFPHATSTRYPAHPNAPVDYREAAFFKGGDSGKARHMGGMGIQHYSNGIGVIYYFRRLAGEAEWTAKAMQDWWRSATSDGLELPRPCRECENAGPGLAPSRATAVARTPITRQ